MSVYIYCPRPSQGALELVRALNCQRLRRFDGADFWTAGKRAILKEGDVLLIWGASAPEIEGIRVLNGTDIILNKYEEWSFLVNNDVPTLTLYLDYQIKRDRAYYISKHNLIGRILKHQGGMDLLSSSINPDFWVVKEKFVREYRIHSFNGRSIRAGVKVHRDGFVLVEDEKKWKPNANLVHPWVRSWDGGWKVSYDDFKSTQNLRSLANKAVKALGLTFGAVDIGELQTGQLKVLEVNRAPGIEGNSVASYVKAIKKWIDNPQDKETEEPTVPF